VHLRLKILILTTPGEHMGLGITAAYATPPNQNGPVVQLATSKHFRTKASLILICCTSLPASF